MHSIHRIYSWVMFIPIATLLIAYATVKLMFNLLISFTYKTFFYEISPPEGIPVPAQLEATFEYWYRVVVALLTPFIIWWDDLKTLKDYKF